MENEEQTRCSLEICRQCLLSNAEVRYDTIPLTSGTGITFGRNDGNSYKACCVTYSKRVKVEKIKLSSYSVEYETVNTAMLLGTFRLRARGRMKIDEWVKFIKNGKRVLYAMDECPYNTEHTLSGWCDEKKKADKKRKRRSL